MPQRQRSGLRRADPLVRFMHDRETNRVGTYISWAVHSHYESQTDAAEFIGRKKAWVSGRINKEVSLKQVPDVLAMLPIHFHAEFLHRYALQYVADPLLTYIDEQLTRVEYRYDFLENLPWIIRSGYGPATIRIAADLWRTRPLDRDVWLGVAYSSSLFHAGLSRIALKVAKETVSLATDLDPGWRAAAMCEYAAIAIRMGAPVAPLARKLQRTIHAWFPADGQASEHTSLQWKCQALQLDAHCRRHDPIGEVAFVVPEKLLKDVVGLARTPEEVVRSHVLDSWVALHLKATKRAQKSLDKAWKLEEQYALGDVEIGVQQSRLNFLLNDHEAMEVAEQLLCKCVECSLQLYVSELESLLVLWQYATSDEKDTELPKVQPARRAAGPDSQVFFVGP